MATLGAGRYLLGVIELLLLFGFAWLGASRLRAWALPRFEGAPAWLATGVIALALLLWTGELLGTVSLFQPVPYLLSMVIVGLVLRALGPNAPPAGGAVGGPAAEEALATAGRGGTAATGPAGRVSGLTLVAVLVAAVALIHFAV